MIRQATLLFMLLPLLPGLGLAQTSNHSAKGKALIAQQAWPAFFTAFKAAVKRHEKVGLKRMMPLDFLCFGWDAYNSGSPDKRDRVLVEWGKNNNDGWKKLTEVLAKGVAPDERFSSPENPRRIAPPKVNNWWDYWAEFEFRGGHWYFTAFRTGEDPN